MFFTDKNVGVLRIQVLIIITINNGLEKLKSSQLTALRTANNSNVPTSVYLVCCYVHGVVFFGLRSKSPGDMDKGGGLGEGRGAREEGGGGRGGDEESRDIRHQRVIRAAPPYKLICLPVFSRRILPLGHSVQMRRWPAIVLILIVRKLQWCCTSLCTAVYIYKVALGPLEGTPICAPGKQIPVYL